MPPTSFPQDKTFRLRIVRLRYYAMPNGRELKVFSCICFTQTLLGSISRPNCTRSRFNFLANGPKDSVAWHGRSPVARVGLLCLLSLTWMALSLLLLIAVRAVGRVTVMLRLLEVDFEAATAAVAAAAAAAVASSGPPTAL